MKLSNRLTPEILAAATGILMPYCPELSPTDLVTAIENHKSDHAAKPQALQPPLTYKGFAQLTGLSLPTVHRMAKRGELQTVKIGLRSVRIPFTAAEKILNGDSTTTISTAGGR